MKPLLFIAVLSLSATSLLLSCGNCTAVCPTRLTLVFVDESGRPLNDVKGVITWPTSAPTEVDCAPHFPDGGSADAGTFARGCTGNTVSIDFPNGNPEGSFTASNGKKFSGPIDAVYQDTGAEMCGSRCRVASVTLVFK